MSLTTTSQTKMPLGSLVGKAVGPSPPSGNNETHDSGEDLHTEGEAEEEEGGGEDKNDIPDSQMAGSGDDQVLGPPETCVAIGSQWSHEGQPRTDSQLKQFTTIRPSKGRLLATVRRERKSRLAKLDRKLNRGQVGGKKPWTCGKLPTAWTDSNRAPLATVESPSRKLLELPRYGSELSESHPDWQPSSAQKERPQCTEPAASGKRRQNPKDDGEVADTEENEGSQDDIRRKRRKLSARSTPLPALPTGFSESNDHHAEAKKTGHPAKTVASVKPLDTANPVESSGTGVLFEPAVPTPVAKAEIITAVQSTAIVTRFATPSFSGHLCAWGDGTKSIFIGTINVVFRFETVGSISDLLRMLEEDSGA